MLEATIASRAPASQATAMRNASVSAETEGQFKSADRRIRWCFYSPGLPKQLMPISAKPMLDFLLHWLRRNNVEDVYITAIYLDHLTRSFVGDGRLWGFNITYTQELEPPGREVCFHSRATSSKAPS
ncbi:MAG: nucleotidyltransferase [Microvirga sp.]|jgi:hypothetical protein|nr:nucleotidyltransferase [Microvirga sp.]